MQLEFGGKRYPITAGESVIGAAPDCAIGLSGEGIRPQHAVLHRSPVGVVIRATVPDAAVLVNGTPVGGDPWPVRPGDTITIGPHDLRVLGADRPTGMATAQGLEEPEFLVAPNGATYRLADTLYGMPAVAEPRVVTPAVPAGSQAGAPPVLAALLVRTGEQKGWRLPLKRPAASIGRAHYNDIALTDPTVSAEHAQLRRRDGLWILTDVGSTNGTYVDGERVSGEAPLAPGASVRFGDVTVLFEPFDAPADELYDEPVDEPHLRPAVEPYREVEPRDASPGGRADEPLSPGSTPAAQPAAEPSRGMPGWLIFAVVAAAAAGAAVGYVLLR